MGLQNKLYVLFGVLIVLTVALAWTSALWWLSFPIVLCGVFGLYFVNSGLEDIEYMQSTLESIAQGDLSTERLTHRQNNEFVSLSTSINQLLTQLRGLAEEAEELSDGYIGVQNMVNKVLSSGDLSVVDLPIDERSGSLNYGFTMLTNQLRRMTVQAQIIANDQLSNRALNESLPGELGDAFQLMIENLRTLSERANEIARGDLTNTVESQGDLGKAFNQMIEGLHELIQGITVSALHIATSSDELFRVMRAQEASATEQSALVEQAHKTVTQLGDASTQVAADASSVFEAAEQTHVNHKLIVNNVEQLNTDVEAIGQILESIQTFADRSDLLAINAGLEATRAGDSGKGFGILAAEMRRLAESITTSADDIKELVRDVRASLQRSRASAHEGQRLSELTTQSAMNIRQVTQRQQRNMRDVTDSMHELATLIHHHAAGTRQVTGAAHNLTALSEHLRHLVGRFQLTTSVEEVALPQEIEAPTRH